MLVPQLTIGGKAAKGSRTRLYPARLRKKRPPASLRHMSFRIPLNRRMPTIFQPARSTIWFTVLASLSLTPVEAATVTNNFVAGQFHELNDNEAWSWFMDERLMVDNGRTIVV
jgi:hypothetical protein